MGAKTPVSILQEMMVRQGCPPKYDLLYDGSGTHATVFKYRVYANDVTAIGSGRSKKEAKHEAARLALEQLSRRQLEPSGTRTPQPEQEVITPYRDKLEENAIGALHDMCLANDIPIPEYLLTDESGPPHDKIFTFVCSVSKQKEIGIGRKKKQAKQLAAYNMMNRLKISLGDVLLDGQNENCFTSSENLDNAAAKYVNATRKKISLKSAPYKYHCLFVETPEEIRQSAWETLCKLEIPLNTCDAPAFDNDWVSHLDKVLECLNAQKTIVPGRSAVNGNSTVFLQIHFSAEAVFLGSDASSDGAVQQAAHGALVFLKIHLQSVQK